MAEVPIECESDIPKDRELIRVNPFQYTPDIWRRALLEYDPDRYEPLDGTVSRRKPRTQRDWQDDSLCAQTDPDLFVRERGGSAGEAKKICSTCPAQLACLAFQLARESQEEGILGGLGERGREKLKHELITGGHIERALAA